MFHGSSLFGMSTTLTGKSLMPQKNKGSFWWRDVFKLVDIYRRIAPYKVGDGSTMLWDVFKLVDLYRWIAPYKVGDGSTMLFWLDVWNDHLLQDKFPRLFSYAKNKSISVLHSSLIIKLRNNSIYHYQFKHFKNIKICNKLSNKYKLQIKAKTFGITARGNSTYTSSKFYHLS
jgi:hypothetical protein